MRPRLGRVVVAGVDEVHDRKLLGNGRRRTQLGPTRHRRSSFGSAMNKGDIVFKGMGMEGD